MILPPALSPTIQSVRLGLADAVRRAVNRSGQGPLVRVSVPVPSVDPFRWLSVQPVGSRALWSARGTDHLVAMSGIADIYEGGSDPDYDRLSRYMHHQLADASDAIRYFGGLRFDGGQVMSREWEAFGSFRFVLPRFELVVEGDRVELACNLVIQRDRSRVDAIVEDIQNLRWPSTADASELPRPVGRHDEPARAEWLPTITDALETIEEREIQKVVLARRSTFAFDARVSPVDLIERLYADTPNRFHYFVEAGDGSAFLGATPERLVRREGTFVFSEAVAGTRPAVDDAADDAQLLAGLLASEKEQREHLCVRWAIEEILRPFCENLSVDAHASEMRLSQGRHLVSRFDGVLREGVETWQLVRHLHPTPAVGGYPAPAAIRAIRKAEQFDRGWYAGPIGWVGRDEAEFAVALRCALVHGSSMHIYSGAGIVTGSVPEAEWDEIEHKIVDFARVLGLAGVHNT
jgi:menaquinone-specific isochorismate synthase